MPDYAHAPEVPAASPMLTALRTGTREAHRAVERELGLPRRIRSRADLPITLAVMLASWQPLEQRLAAHDWSALGLDAHLGEAAHLLRADLAAVNGEPLQPGPTAPSTVRFDTLARAVGGRYVLLGSAMGGRVIAPVVERRLGTPPGWATGFFRRTGMAPDQDWHAFGAAVTGHRWSTDQLEQAVRAARQTFEIIGRTAASLLTGVRRP